MRGRINIALKHYYLCRRPHGVTIQNAKILVSTVMTTANLTSVLTRIVTNS
jgi:hypothetical protein